MTNVKYCWREMTHCCRQWSGSFLMLVCLVTKGFAQDCPPNIDFETGTFAGWTCYVGRVEDAAGTNQILLSESSPVQGRQTMFARTAVPQLDPYGQFPVVSPNGSNYSVRLGNDLAGTEAEGLAYEFTIPANRNVYSLIYHYAVVFQDPNHLQHQQPRLVIEITNLTDNQLISCSSFTFFPYGTPLPGFYEATYNPTTTPIWCKNWTAVSINLDGHAGQRIRLFFKTADCTFRRHFGYAYIDVNSECSGEFTGATFCPGDTAVQVQAPYGYQDYTWYNTSFTSVVGTQQTLTLRPAPPAGTSLAVEVKPYFGYGCPDTLYARLVDTLKIKAVAGEDRTVCFGTPEQIGSPPKPGIYYSWSPSTGLSDPAISNPFANPPFTTNYVLTTRSYGGGCTNNDTVVVKPVVIDSTITLLGSDMFCRGYGDSAVFLLSDGNQFQWYKNNTVINAANGPRYRVQTSGNYRAQIYKDGCTVATASRDIVIEDPKAGIAYPTIYTLETDPVNLQARNFGQDYLWRPATSLNTPASATPVFSGSTDQLYTIQITTRAGCVTVDTQAVKIVKEMNIMVPNAFTPNGDGKNDILRPVLFGMRQLVYFRVFNRWGQLLYETHTLNEGWDGNFRGMKQGNEVVVWVAEALGQDGKRYVRKGTCMCIQ